VGIFTGQMIRLNTFPSDGTISVMLQPETEPPSGTLSSAKESDPTAVHYATPLELVKAYYLTQIYLGMQENSAAVYLRRDPIAICDFTGLPIGKVTHILENQFTHLLGRYRSWEDAAAAVENPPISSVQSTAYQEFNDDGIPTGRLRKIKIPRCPSLAELEKDKS
jgi:hypothetical protein